MGIRSTLASIVGGDSAEASIRPIVEQILAAKGSVRPADMQELRDRIAAVEGEAGGGEARRLDALETEVNTLRKKLTMAMGAIQAATAQLADVRRASDGASADARQALSRAESALATVESLSDGVEALEDAVEGRTNDTRVDINVAAADALADLPGVGPTVADRIVADRKANGRFQSVADIARVKGLGTATARRLVELVKV